MEVDSRPGESIKNKYLNSNTKYWLDIFFETSQKLNFISYITRQVWYLFHYSQSHEFSEKPILCRQLMKLLKNGFLSLQQLCT